MRRSEWVLKTCRSNPMPANHSATSRAYCRVVIASLGRRRLVNRNPPATLLVTLKVVVNGLAGLLGQLETDWTPGLSLAHRRTGERVAVWSNVFDPYRDHIAAS